MRVTSFLKWVSGSLFGHVLFYGLLFTITLSPTFIYLNYVQESLTLSWAIYVVIVCVILGSVGGFLIWSTITLPRLKRRDRSLRR
jgi:hypothetical protein